MPFLSDRILNPKLISRVVPVEDAVKFVKDGMVLAVSGFTKSGEPKTFLPALARHLSAHAPETRIALMSGASLSEEVEGPLAPFIAKRSPYMSSTASRLLIHAGKMDFSDVHLSAFSRNLIYGFYGEVDLAVVEVCRINADGSVVLTSSVGISAEALALAKQIIIEVNTASPDYSGFHDLLIPRSYPDSLPSLPISQVGDRIGETTIRIDPSKVVAVVESSIPDHPVAFKEATPVERQIAGNTIDFLMHCDRVLGWKGKLPPLQSGVGSIANAVIGELKSSPFERIRFWTEVFQDGMMKYLEDEDLLEFASSTALSLSASAQVQFQRQIERCRERLVLRPVWVSNSPELITRLFVIAINTPIEVDIYGHVNSTHVGGSKLVNGLGGSGDFLRNAYLSAVHTPSVRKLRDGRTVSCVMPYVRHIDHTEHDIKCVITEQGYALNLDIRSPKKRAIDIIEHCAHPYFRPLLHDYMRLSGDGDEPRPSKLSILEGWWKEYDQACRAFAQAAL